VNELFICIGGCLGLQTDKETKEEEEDEKQLTRKVRFSAKPNVVDTSS
jgi:hypothetical protein